MVRLLLCGLLLFASCAASSLGQVPPGTTGQGEPLPPPVAPTPGQAAAVAPPPAETQPPSVAPPSAAAPGAPPSGVAPPSGSSPAPPTERPRVGIAADPGADADFETAK